MSYDFSMYWWLTFCGSLLMLIDIPSKQPAWANLIGTMLAAMFGFILWPVYLIAWVRMNKR